MTGWTVERASGGAAGLHAVSAELVASTVAAPATPRVRILDAVRPAVVLGSGQPLAHVDHAALERQGWDLARRRSGGGAVLVGVDEVLWVDVIVPVGDPLWSDDVRMASAWLGACWSQALARTGPGGGEVWAGGLVAPRWSDRVCFAGLGPGEVTVGGRKMVGLAQRRTRRAALFQTAALLRWHPADLVGVMAFDGGAAARSAAASELAGVARGAGPSVRDDLLEALLHALARRREMA